MIEERSGGLGLACACWAWGLVRSPGRAGGSGQLGMMDWKNTSKGVCVCVLKEVPYLVICILFVILP